MFFAAPLLRSNAISRRDKKRAIKATVRPVVMLRQLLSCAPCQALSITLSLLADIHTAITDCAWIIHRPGPGEEQDASRCCQMTAGVHEWVCLCSITRKKEKEGNSKHQPRSRKSLSWFCTQLEIICSYHRVHSVKACVNTCLKLCPKIPTISFRGTYLYWEDMQGLSVFVNAPHFWTQLRAAVTTQHQRCRSLFILYLLPTHTHREWRLKHMLNDNTRFRVERVAAVTWLVYSGFRCY